MTPHSSLNIVPNILAIWTDIDNRNSIMHGLAKVRVLQMRSPIMKVPNDIKNVDGTEKIFMRCFTC